MASGWLRNNLSNFIQCKMTFWGSEGWVKNANEIQIYSLASSLHLHTDWCYFTSLNWKFSISDLKSIPGTFISSATANLSLETRLNKVYFFPKCETEIWIWFQTAACTQVARKREFSQMKLKSKLVCSKRFCWQTSWLHNFLEKFLLEMRRSGETVICLLHE